MIKLRKANRHEKEDYPTAVATITIGNHEAQLTQKDIDSLHSKLNKFTTHSVINWVPCSERLPNEALGNYLACLGNNTIHNLNYSNITNKWWDLKMRDIKEHNPVKYWAELPDAPFL